jgi:hypothetical protein
MGVEIHQSEPEGCLVSTVESMAEVLEATAESTLGGDQPVG